MTRQSRKPEKPGKGKARMLWMVSPVKAAEDRAQAAEEIARIADRNRADAERHAETVTRALNRTLEVADGIGGVGQDVRGVWDETRHVGRKVDAMHTSLDVFLAQSVPAAQAELRSALDALHARSGQEGGASAEQVEWLARKLDGLSQSVHGLLARTETGAHGPGPQEEELRDALAAVQSVNLVGQDVRTLSKEFDALRELMLAVLDGERPRGRHHRPGTAEEEPEAPEGGPAGTGLSPDEEERWLR